jgi:hypothetical protein
MGDNTDHDVTFATHTPHIYAKDQDMPVSQPTQTLENGIIYPMHIFRHTDRGRPVGLESITDPSSQQFDTTACSE